VNTSPAARNEVIWHMSATESQQHRHFTYCDMVCSLRIRRNSNGNADDAEQHVHDGPPREVGIPAVDG
jgi:hypothetical protein